MIKYDGSVMVISSYLRRIISDLLNEENYSGEKVEVEPPTRKYSKKYMKYVKYNRH